MQSEQLAYAIVTPYSMRKSRTGGIVGRLISRTGLDLVGGRMFAPGAELTKRYADTIVTETDPSHRATQQLIREYVLKNFTGEKNGQHARILFLIFRGPDAAEKIHHVVGHILHERTSGETIRDTYGDYITDDSENVVYFEPGVVTEFEPGAVERDLKLWAEFSDSDGGIVDYAVPFPQGTQIEKTLVLIKPDNFRFPNLRPGGVIEVFSRTGLSIIGFKVHQMSVAQAEEFYGPVLPVLEKKLGPKSGASVIKTNATRPERRNRLPLFTRAWTQCAKFATSSAPLIRQKRLPVRSERSSDKRSWLTPRMHRIPSRTRNAKWRSSESKKIISNL
jgi:nucleoside diphosphate kinase